MVEGEDGDELGADPEGRFFKSLKGGATIRPFKELGGGLVEPNSVVDGMLMGVIRPAWRYHWRVIEGVLGLDMALKESGEPFRS